MIGLILRLLPFILFFGGFFLLPDRILDHRGTVIGGAIVLLIFTYIVFGWFKYLDRVGVFMKRWDRD